MTARPDPFTPADVEQLRRRGLTVEEARRQLDRLTGPPVHVDLDRPCTVGDGIERLSAERIASLGEHHAAAAERGRLTKFVPASGAASRMFKHLLRFHSAGGDVPRERIEQAARAGDGEARAALEFFDGIPAFAFRGDLARAVGRAGGTLDELLAGGRYGPVLDALLTTAGLDYASLPKGLLKFHDGPEGPRTPFEEHLVEAAGLVRDGTGVCRLHFTVSPQHRALFDAELEEVRGRLERGGGVRLSVGFSVQKPSTDTLAVGLDGRPLRDADGSLQLRPAGHGALIENLADLGADVVLIKNIDNVVPDRLKGPTYTWSRACAGRLVEIEETIARLLGGLSDPATSGAAVGEAAAFARDVLHRAPPAGSGARELAELLDRPLRVCGMVPNTGEPGGGPFWVRGGDRTLSLQIVESAQVDPSSETQQGLFARSTHHNPVFLVCGLRDGRGRPHDLASRIDRDAEIVTRKSAGGREIRALERPGLWNGAMAGWNTVFVEVPIEVYNPVKTINALLRDAHRSG